MVVLNYSDGHEPARYTGGNADWYAVAQQLGARFVPSSFRTLTGRKMFIPFNGWVVVLSDRGDDSQRAVLARILFRERHNLWLTLHLYPRRMDNPLDRLLSWPGCRLNHRVHIDDPAFDRHGFLRCPDATIAQKLFGESSFRSSILDQAPGWLRVSPRKHDRGVAQLSLYHSGAWIADEDLLAIHKATIATLSRLIAIGWAASDAPQALES